MSDILCASCWFRKTTEEGEESHNAFRYDLKEGDCSITKKRCNHEWDSYSKARSCPVNIKFYNDVAIAQANAILGERAEGSKPKPTPKPKPKPEHGYAQMSLFEYEEEIGYGN